MHLHLQSSLSSATRFNTIIFLSGIPKSISLSLIHIRHLLQQESWLTNAAIDLYLANLCRASHTTDHAVPLHSVGILLRCAIRCTWRQNLNKAMATELRVLCEVSCDLRESRKHKYSLPSVIVLPAYHYSIHRFHHFVRYKKIKPPSYFRHRTRRNILASISTGS